MEDQETYTKMNYAIQARDQITFLLETTEWQEEDIEDLFIIRQKIEKIIRRITWEK